MKIFENRASKEYIDFVNQLLSFDNLSNTYTKIDTDNRFKKIIEIDFFGISGSSLLRFSNSQNSISKNFESIYNSQKEFNELGIRIKSRFLFSYLYSDFAISLIEAEKSKNRATIIDNKYKLNYNTNNELDIVDFNSSDIYKNQAIALEHIQRLLEKYNLNGPKSPNRILTRFSPLPINFCGLKINDTYIFDSYSYSKENLFDIKLAYNSPILVVNKNDNESVYKRIEDHFRYLWNHDLTMFSEDATNFDINIPNSLRDIRKPNNLTFNYKTSIIDKIEKDSKLHTEVEIKERRAKWLFSVKNRIIDNTRMISKTPAKETLFIACSWKELNDGTYEPNKIANGIKNFLDITLGERSNINVLKTILIKPKIGSDISEKIYSGLNQSTLGLIVMTPDYKDENEKQYSVQNVIHELGYMMGKLNKTSGKVFVLKHKEVTTPSNISSYDYKPFDNAEETLRYFFILEWLYLKSSSITNLIINKAFDDYKKLLVEELKSGKINHKQLNEINRKITLHNKVYK